VLPCACIRNDTPVSCCRQPRCGSQLRTTISRTSPLSFGQQFAPPSPLISCRCSSGSSGSGSGTGSGSGSGTGSSSGSGNRKGLSSSPAGMDEAARLAELTPVELYSLQEGRGRGEVIHSGTALSLPRKVSGMKGPGRCVFWRVDCGAPVNASLIACDCTTCPGSIFSLLPLPSPPSTRSFKPLMQLDCQSHGVGATAARWASTPRTSRFAALCPTQATSSSSSSSSLPREVRAMIPTLLEGQGQAAAAYWGDTAPQTPAGIASTAEGPPVSPPPAGMPALPLRAQALEGQLPQPLWPPGASPAPPPYSGPPLPHSALQFAQQAQQQAHAHAQLQQALHLLATHQTSPRLQQPVAPAVLQMATAPQQPSSTGAWGRVGGPMQGGSLPRSSLRQGLPPFHPGAAEGLSPAGPRMPLPPQPPITMQQALPVQVGCADVHVYYI
jgi:hypothetical protein